MDLENALGILLRRLCGGFGEEGMVREGGGGEGVGMGVGFGGVP